MVAVQMVSRSRKGIVRFLCVVLLRFWFHVMYYEMKSLVFSVAFNSSWDVVYYCPSILTAGTLEMRGVS